MKLILDPLKNLHLPQDDLGHIGLIGGGADGREDADIMRIEGNISTYFNCKGVWWDHDIANRRRDKPRGSEHVWRTKQGSHILIKDMDTKHIINSIYLLYSKMYVPVFIFLSCYVVEILYEKDTENYPLPRFRNEYTHYKPSIELDWFYEELTARKVNIPLPSFISF
jgi:hypothetical protein